MGLIKAALGAAGGVMADQWLEYFYCDSLPENVMAVKGQKRSSGRSSNTRGSDNIISNGSVIAVADGQYFGIIFLFAVGAALGGHMIGYIGARTIWISCIILLISFLCMFIKEEKKEHPEIVQEEREIRENLQNIRKEAKDVEHILEDDIRSQIEKKK